MEHPSTVDKFAHFHVIEGLAYGSIRHQPLLTDLIIPKTLATSKRGPRPVLVNVHGGGLIGGSRDFQPWWTAWLLEWAEQNGAIIVAPDYPLAPESKSPEIVSGLMSFMRWLDSSLQSAVDELSPIEGLEADLSRVLVAGESAGAWCAFHMALAFPDKIHALILRFGMLDMGDREFYGSQRKVAGLLPGLVEPPARIFEEHVAAMRRGRIIIQAGPQRLPLVFGIFMKGNFYEALGETEETFPLSYLKKDGTTRLPSKIWLFHGLDDPVVDVRGSERALELIQENVRGTEVKFDTRPGSHGFDTEWHLDGEEAVMKERLAWLTDGWKDEN